MPRGVIYGAAPLRVPLLAMDTLLVAQEYQRALKESGQDRPNFGDAKTDEERKKAVETIATVVPILDTFRETGMCGKRVTTRCRRDTIVGVSCVGKHRDHPSIQEGVR